MFPLTDIKIIELYKCINQKYLPIGEIQSLVNAHWTQGSITLSLIFLKLLITKYDALISGRKKKLSAEA